MDDYGVLLTDARAYHALRYIVPLDEMAKLAGLSGQWHALLGCYVMADNRMPVARSNGLLLYGRHPHARGTLKWIIVRWPTPAWQWHAHWLLRQTPQATW